MKKHLQLFLIVILFIFKSQPTLAIVEPNTTKNNQVIKPTPKLTFSQKIIKKIIERRLKKSLKHTNSTEEHSNGNIWAICGFCAVLIGLGLLIIATIPALSSIVFLKYFAILLNLSGLVASIVALTKKGLSSLSTVLAWLAISIFALELFTFIIILLALLFFISII